MGVPELLDFTRDRADADAAIVFVHGFGGDAKATWGDFPQILRQEPRLSDWAICSLGYQSTLAPDIRGVWSGDPGIATLATHLRTRVVHDLEGKRLALIAHSMGGLVVQQALVTHPDVASKTSHVILYGTPSGGLEKSSNRLARWFKRQTADMGVESDFIRELRAKWRARFGDRDQPSRPANPCPFVLAAVAGDRDEFVPASSSLACFADADRYVVPGNHLEIVKPDDSASLSAKTAIRTIVGDASPAGPWNAARCAVEMGDFRRAIEILEPNKDDLDEPSSVQLAIALDSIGRRDAAIEVLEIRHKRGGTDAMGTLAGRFKRIWWAEGLETPARKAQDLYQRAYGLSVEAADWPQAFYHGINVAFMSFVLDRDATSAAETARKVLEHCARVAIPDVWCLAAAGEAHFYLGESADALASYRQAVETEPQPWQMRSMFTQATRVAEALGDEASIAALQVIFRQQNG